MPAEKTESRVVKVSHLLDEKRLNVIQRQPGVLSVIAFDEGFPVKSMGKEDFEQVAAIAEDFLRTSERVTSDMRMGVLNQITLEGREKKCIIVPYGDLSLCLITTSDANLGLIRLAIRHLQAMEIPVHNGNTAV
jgi:predicted regulator of Ras-like GTPase activity (Roadblock/LC7/MglB family)